MLQKSIFPPACVGILGGGQLGMMLAQIAKQFGYKVAILEADVNCPAAKYADYHIKTAYDDKIGLQQLADISEVITTEFENVPASSVDFLSLQTPTYPAAKALQIAQNRISEKTFFKQCGLATAKFHAITGLSDCDKVSAEFFPAILKTTTLGYDGKGQQSVADVGELHTAYQNLGAKECILEQRIEIAKEISVIIARNLHGSAVFAPLENQHRNGILDVSYFPARISPDLEHKASAAAMLIADNLDYTGLLTVEFFVTPAGELLVNEIAPRPHNSGHITLDAAVSSQFEQQLRAVCGLPLGSTQLKQAGAMLNLLGDIWLNSATMPEELILTQFPTAKLHLYGKTQAKVGRKMGHLNLAAENSELLEQKIKQIKLLLGIS